MKGPFSACCLPEGRERPRSGLGVLGGRREGRNVSGAWEGRVWRGGWVRRGGLAWYQRGGGDGVFGGPTAGRDSDSAEAAGEEEEGKTEGRARPRRKEQG